MKAEKIQFGIQYIDTQSPLHALNGITKFSLFLAWITVVLTTFDLRVILSLISIGMLLLAYSKVPFPAYKPLLVATFSVLSFNALFMFAIAPQQGSEWIGTSTELLRLPFGYTLTNETLFYLITVTLKYFSMFPIALVFVFTTHPTEFASSLNRMGLPYKVAYAISLTLRYLPEVKNDFTHIMHAQQARGVDLSKKAPLMTRFKGVANILIPLIFSSLDRADEIANAMTLRGFGRQKQRTWYNNKNLTTLDKSVLFFTLIIVSALLTKSYLDNQIIWYPL